MQDLRPGSVDGPLHEESYDFLSQSSLRLFRGKNASEPDVMLKLGDDKLPAHRSLLAESSDVFEAMFQASSAYLELAPVHVKFEDGLEHPTVSGSSRVAFLYWDSHACACQSCRRKLAVAYRRAC